VEQVLARAGVRRGQTAAEVQRRLLGREEALARLALGRLAEIGRKEGIQVAIISARLPLEEPGPDVRSFMRVAEEVGIHVLDLLHVYDGHDEVALKVTNLDHHPTAEGHRLLAEGLLAQLEARPALLGLGADGPTTAPAVIGATQ
jgi:hypothetical protein